MAWVTWLGLCKHAAQQLLCTNVMRAPDVTAPPLHWPRQRQRARPCCRASVTAVPILRCFEPACSNSTNRSATPPREPASAPLHALTTHAQSPSGPLHSITRGTPVSWTIRSPPGHRPGALSPCNHSCMPGLRRQQAPAVDRPHFPHALHNGTRARQCAAAAQHSTACTARTCARSQSSAACGQAMPLPGFPHAHVVLALFKEVHAQAAVAVVKRVTLPNPRGWPPCTGPRSSTRARRCAAVIAPPLHWPR